MEMQRSLPQPWNSLWWAHQGSYFIHNCTAASSLWAVPLGKVSVWVCVCIWVRGIPRFCRNPKETQVIRKRRVRVQEAARFLTRREKNNPWKPLGWISKHGSRKKSPRVIEYCQKYTNRALVYKKFVFYNDKQLFHTHSSAEILQAWSGSSDMWKYSVLFWGFFFKYIIIN